MQDISWNWDNNIVPVGQFHSIKDTEKNGILLEKFRVLYSDFIAGRLIRNPVADQV